MIHLSPSAIRTFTTCGLKYKYHYIDHLPQGPDSPQSESGTRVHQALFNLCYNNWPLAQATEHLTDDETTMVLAEVQFMTTHSRTMLGAELRFEVPVRPDCQMVGIVDRLDRESDGLLVVVDYKTGKIPTSDFIVTQIIQQGIYYAWLIHQTMDIIPKIEFHYLQRPGIIISHISNPQEMMGITTRLESLITTLESNKFDPQQSNLCSVCPYMALCPLWGGHPLA